MSRNLRQIITFTFAWVSPATIFVQIKLQGHLPMLVFNFAGHRINRSPYAVYLRARKMFNIVEKTGK